MPSAEMDGSEYDGGIEIGNVLPRKIGTGLAIALRNKVFYQFHVSVESREAAKRAAAELRQRHPSLVFTDGVGVKDDVSDLALVDSNRGGVWRQMESSPKDIVASLLKK